MPGVRQVITGLPPQNGATAFMPLRVLTQSVMSVQIAQGTPEGIVGQPGTQGIPAPYPAPGQVGVTGTGKGKVDYLPSGLSASQYMPTRWYPSLYYRAQHLSRSIGGVSVYSDNLMPVPAADPRGIPSGVIGPVGFAAYRGLTPAQPARPNRWARGLGQAQVTWPKRLPSWEDWKNRP